MTTPTPEQMGDLVEADDEAMVDPDDYPWSTNPDWVTLAPISELAFRIYAILRAHVSKDRPKPFPAQATLAKMLGYAKTDPIRAAIKELVAIGAVTTELKPCPKGQRTHYKTHMTPAPGVKYVGPLKTSDLYEPGVLDDLAEKRAKRKRGVSRNPSGLRKDATP